MLQFDEVNKAAQYVLSKISQAPTLGVTLGTGLADAVKNMQVELEIPYADVPNMPITTNPVHPGKFVFGTLYGTQTICMQGRIHMYEGYSVDQVVFPVFLTKLLGVKTLIVTNASGAINVDYNVEELILIKDHINFSGHNPLRLNIDSRLGVPCPDMSYAYTPALRKAAIDAAASKGEVLREGVYLGLFGPSFETPAEIRAFRSWGADLVGMSTVNEVIAASAAGIDVLGISLVTNMAAGVVDKPIEADDITNLKSDVPARIGQIIESVL